jgi:hypothetical protein
MRGGVEKKVSVDDLRAWEKRNWPELAWTGKMGESS